MVNFFIQLLAVLYTACVLLPTVTGDGDFTLCESESDPIKYNRRHKKIFNLDNGIVNKEDIELNFEGVIITCINAINNWHDGTGGTATLKAGGLGLSSATVLLQGQIFRGYSFDVIVRGRPDTRERTTPITTNPPPTTDMVTPSVRTRSQSNFCGDSSQSNIFDDRIFVPSFDID